MMKLQALVSKQGEENIDFTFDARIVKPHAIAIIDQLSLHHIGIYLICRTSTFVPGPPSRLILQQEIIIFSKCSDSTLCNAISFDDLQTQNFIFYQRQALSKAVIDIEWVFLYRKIEVKSGPWFCLIQFIANHLLRHLDADAKLIPDAEQQTLHLLFFLDTLSLNGCLTLIPSEHNGKEDCSDRADGLYPSGPISCFDVRGNKPPTKRENCCRADCNRAYFMFKRHSTSNLSWRNRNTSSIGGGK